MHDTQRPLETSLGWHLAMLAAAMLWPTASTCLYFLVLADTPWMAPVYGATKVVQFALPLVWVLGVQKSRLRLAGPDARSLGWGAAIGGLILAAGLTLYFGVLRDSAWFVAAPVFIAHKIGEMGLAPKGPLAEAAAASPLPYVLFASFLALPHSLAEEYYYRWFIHGQLRRVAPFAPATALSSLAFMGHHVLVLGDFFVGQPLAVAFFSGCVAVGGAIWAWLFERTRSLYGPWLSHLLVDAAVMFVGYDLVWGG